MTQQSKEELFRLYLEGKLDFAKKDQSQALDDLFAAEFGTSDYFNAAERYQQAGNKVQFIMNIRAQFNSIFGKAES